MSPSEQAAFHAGIKHAVAMAQIAALQIELQPDAGHVRQRAAIEALRGLADGLKASLPGEGSAQSVAGSANPTRSAAPTSAPPPACNLETALAAGFTGDACAN